MPAAYDRLPGVGTRASGFLDPGLGPTLPEPPRFLDEAGRGRQLRHGDEYAAAEAA